MKYIAMNNEARSHGKESTKPWKKKHEAMEKEARSHAKPGTEGKKQAKTHFF